MEARFLPLNATKEIDRQAEAGRNEVVAGNPTEIGCLAADQRWCVTRRVTEPDNCRGRERRIQRDRLGKCAPRLPMAQVSDQ